LFPGGLRVQLPSYGWFIESIFVEKGAKKKIIENVLMVILHPTKEIDTLFLVARWITKVGSLNFLQKDLLKCL
jgi:hypothetical protein